uniref:Uncharacterized protein n=1 Tax=viral metagenome TaxID=1070528 RepID=A0A6C0ECQ8_9ZZZZ
MSAKSESDTLLDSSDELESNDTKSKNRLHISKSEMTKLFKSIKDSGRIRNNYLELNFRMSDELYKYLCELGWMDLFTKASLSKYLPLKYLTDANIKTRIDWTHVSCRTDLTREFIKTHKKKLDVTKLLNSYVLSYKDMEDHFAVYYGSLYDVPTVMINTLKSPDFNHDQKMNLLKILVDRVKIMQKNNNQTSDDMDVSTVLELYLKNIYNPLDGSNVVSLVKFLKLLKQIGNMDYSSILFNKFAKSTHSVLNDFEWNYLIHNEVIGFPNPKKGDVVPINVKNIFANKLTYFKNVYLDFSLSHHKIEDIIVKMLMNGYDSHKLWSEVSKSIDPYATPYWFLKKYQKDLDWNLLFITVVNKYNYKTITLENMLIWVQDHHDKISIVSDKVTNQIFPEELLYHFGDKKNIFPKIVLADILARQIISVAVLDKLNPIFDNDLWTQVSLCQYLNPTFIKKYESKLNWDKLAYNPTWQLYPQNEFHKLPTFDSKNMLWMPLDKKVTEIKNVLLKKDLNAKVTLENDNIVIKSRALKKPYYARINETHTFFPCCSLLTTNTYTYDYCINRYNYYGGEDATGVSFFGPELCFFATNKNGNGGYGYDLEHCFRAGPLYRDHTQVQTPIQKKSKKI